MKYNIVKNCEVIGEAIFHTPQAITIILRPGVKFVDIKSEKVRCTMNGVTKND